MCIKEKNGANDVKPGLYHLISLYITRICTLLIHIRYN